jgi:hypothetical protein
MTKTELQKENEYLRQRIEKIDTAARETIKSFQNQRGLLLIEQEAMRAKVKGLSDLCGMLLHSTGTAEFGLDQVSRFAATHKTLYEATTDGLIKVTIKDIKTGGVAKDVN